MVTTEKGADGQRPKSTTQDGVFDRAMTTDEAENEKSKARSNDGEEGKGRLTLGNQAAMTSLVSISMETLPSPLPEHNPAAAGFHMLSWQRLTGCLICEAIALGALSLPRAFATLGMIPGILATAGMGFMSIYTSLIIGEVKYCNPQITDYAELGRLLFGKPGYVFVAFMLVMLCILSTGGHVLTGIIALESLSRHALCSVVFGIISAAVLFLLGLPKTFHKMAILAYVDFASIILAVLVTVIVCAIESHNKPGGWAATRWYAFLPANDRASFVDCTISITNLAMSYAYAQCLPSFMAELRRPQDYRKAVWSLGGFQIVFYSLTGSLIYFFKGQSVEAPALLSLEPTMQKVVFGIAIPVIFISGSINSQTASRFIYHHIFPLRSPHHYISTRLGKVVWIGLSFAVTTIAWIAAEVIPSFPTFLGLVAALFAACFTFTIPALLYIKVLRYTSPRTKKALQRHWETTANVFIFAFGLFLFFAGSACCIISLVHQYYEGVSAPFAC